MPLTIHKLSLHCCLLAMLTVAYPALAAHTGPDSEEKIASPETIEGVINVDAEGLIKMVMSTPDLVLIDSRIHADRKEGYIEGSISLPDIETTCDSLANALPQLDNPVMFYCNGVNCGRSANAAVIAIDCGYSNILWFRHGIEEWQEKEYPLVH